jgi:hypothetical protein
VPALDLRVQRLNVRRGRKLADRWDDDPRSPAPSRHPHPARRVRRGGVVETFQTGVQTGLEVGDERLRVAGLADRRIVHVAVVLEVGREILVGVTPAVRAGAVDLPAPERVPQRAQDAQLVRDALDLAMLVDHRVAPFIREHPVDRDALAGRVEPLLTWRLDMAVQQCERVHHRPVERVGAAELEGVQDPREHPPVVV